jgi:hypothetical protein
MSRKAQNNSTDSGADGFDQGYDGVRRRQIRLGLKLTPAERLRWLEQALSTFSAWQGRAHKKNR